MRGGTANIYDGKFSGRDSYTASDGTPVAGPVASYSFKMYGGTANIYGGDFSSQGSGAFIMGSSAASIGTANIYAGNFRVTGQGGISIFQYANVTFAPADANGNINRDAEIYVEGDAAGLILEGINNRAAGTTITVNAGNFNSIRNSNGDGCWSGNYQADIVITGGTFTGSPRSGLTLANAPSNGGSVQISGGTFIREGGSSNAISCGGTIRYNQIIASGAVGTLYPVGQTWAIGTTSGYGNSSINDTISGYRIGRIVVTNDGI